MLVRRDRQMAEECAAFRTGKYQKCAVFRLLDQRVPKILVYWDEPVRGAGSTLFLKTGETFDYQDRVAYEDQQITEMGGSSGPTSTKSMQIL